MRDMIVLGVDTSGLTLSVALARHGQPLGEISLSMGYRHSITFQPAVDQLLTACDLTLKEVDLFAVAAGPGSFTGIRIGLAAVKAMAYAANARTIGISSLRALARSSGGDGLVAPLLDARGGRVFSSLYRGSLQLLEEAPREIGDLLTALESILEADEELLITGNGMAVWQQGLQGQAPLPFRPVFASPAFSYIRGLAVIELALEDLEKDGTETDPFLLEARYGIASSAERGHHGLAGS